MSFDRWMDKENVGLPWWRSGWESACQCRGHGFEPRSGRISHAVEQLGPCATMLGLCSGAHEPQLLKPTHLEPMLCNGRGHHSERPMHPSEEWHMLVTTGDGLHAATKTQRSQKKKKKMWCIYTMEYYWAIKKNEIMPFAATWMDLEIIILSEVSQRETDIIWYLLYVESKKNNTNEFIYETETDSQT